MEIFLPSPALQPFIQAYKVIESREEKVNRVVPDTAPAMAFRFKGQVCYLENESTLLLPASVITGLRNTVRLIHYQPHTSTMIVQLKAAGATAFFKTPLHELFGQNVSLDHFFHRQSITDIEEQLSAAASHAQRVTLLDQFLLSHLKTPRPDALVLNALQQLHITHGDINIKALAAAHYLSQDAFEKRFRKIMGTTPKQMASIIRMRTLLQQPVTKLSLTHLALEAGYFDQAHFNRSFKQFTGLTPTAFYQAPLFW